MLLADEPGLGKTATAILVANELELANRIVIACPAIARAVWKQEWFRWTTRDKVPVYTINDSFQMAQMGTVTEPAVFIVSYDYFSMMSPFEGVSEARFALSKVLRDKDFMILDECHYLKDTQSNRTKEVFKLAEDAGLLKLGRVLALSGTPAPNHYGEVYPLFAGLWPDRIVSGNGHVMSRERFEDFFCEIDFPMVNGRSIRRITGSKNHKKLKEMLNGVMIRRKKKDVFGDMPPLIFDTLPLPTPKDAPDFSILRKPMDDEEVLAFVKVAPATVRREVGLSKVRPCVDYILSQLEPDPTRKIVVFAIHHEVIDELMDQLRVFKPVKIDGRSSEKEREDAVDGFQNRDNRVFVGQIIAAGTAITLTAASEVLFVESDYVPGNNIQAASRCHRIGQTETVIARHVVLAGGVDERVQRILARKEAELALVF
jgi:SNF2 family DNA or RNA helicase